MNKSNLIQFAIQLKVGSSEYVIAHAARQTKRGKNPSMPFLYEYNPRKALILAQQVQASPLLLQLHRTTLWIQYTNSSRAKAIHQERMAAIRAASESAIKDVLAEIRVKHHSVDVDALGVALDRLIAGSKSLTLNQISVDKARDEAKLSFAEMRIKMFG